MSDASGDPDLATLVVELTRALQELEEELEGESRVRPPTPRELSRFTSEVAIPGLILVLQTNVRALQLLRRTIRLAEGREDAGNAGAVRERARELGASTLAGLDDVLDDVQEALEARPEDHSDAIERTRELNEQLRDRLDEHDSHDAGERDESGTDAADGTPDDAVNIDVERELRALKDDVDDGSPGGGDDAGTDGGTNSTDADDGSDHSKSDDGGSEDDGTNNTDDAGTDGGSEDDGTNSTDADGAGTDGDDTA